MRLQFLVKPHTKGDEAVAILPGTGLCTNWNPKDAASLRKIVLSMLCRVSDDFHYTIYSSDRANHSPKKYKGDIIEKLTREAMAANTSSEYITLPDFVYVKDCYTLARKITKFLRSVRHYLFDGSHKNKLTKRNMRLREKLKECKVVEDSVFASDRNFAQFLAKWLSRPEHQMACLAERLSTIVRDNYKANNDDSSAKYINAYIEVLDALTTNESIHAKYFGSMSELNLIREGKVVLITCPDNYPKPLYLERILRNELADIYSSGDLVLIDCSKEIPVYHSLYYLYESMYPNADTSYTGRYIFIRSLNEKGIDKASFGFRDTAGNATGNGIYRADTLTFDYTFDQMKTMLPVINKAWSDYVENKIVLKSNEFTVTYDNATKTFHDDFHNRVVCKLG
jgi:hypothetical protein